MSISFEKHCEGYDEILEKLGKNRLWTAENQNWKIKNGKVEQLDNLGNLLLELPLLKYSDEFLLQFNWQVFLNRDKVIDTNAESKLFIQSKENQINIIFDCNLITPVEGWNNSIVQVTKGKLLLWLNETVIFSCEMITNDFEKNTRRYLKFLPSAFGSLHIESVYRKITDCSLLDIDLTSNLIRSGFEKGKLLSEQWIEYADQPQVQEFSLPENQLDEICDTDTCSYYQYLAKSRYAPPISGILVLPKSVEQIDTLVVCLPGLAASPEFAAFHCGGGNIGLINGGIERGYGVLIPRLLWPSSSYAPYNNSVRLGIRSVVDKKLKLGNDALTQLEVSCIVKTLESFSKTLNISNFSAISYCAGGGHLFYLLSAAATRKDFFLNACVFNNFPQICNLVHNSNELELQMIIESLGKVKLNILYGKFGIEEGVKLFNESKLKYKTLLPDDTALTFTEFNGGLQFNGHLTWQFVEESLKSK